MAIRLVDTYPNRTGAPDANYPHGIPRNRSAPSAVDGTPFEQAWFRDKEGFMQGLLETAGITPSGNPDTVETSDYLDALVIAMHGVVDVDMGGDQDVTLGIYPSRVAALRLTGVLGADVDLIAPDTERFYWIIDETTGGFSVTVRTNSGVGVELSDSVSVVRSDGSDVFSSGPGAGIVGYDSTESGLESDNVQGAIDELSGRVSPQDQPTWNSGESTDESVISPLKLDTKIKTLAIGEGQDWQDLTASRAVSVVYTNSTGRAIQVLISTNNNSLFIFEIDGVSISVQDADPGVSIVSSIIPDGSTYELTGQTNTSGFKWLELR